MESKQIVVAMTKAWAKFPTVERDRTNPHFRNEYATLDGIIKTVKPILKEHGLWISQAPVPTADGASVQTRLYHESGECLDLGTITVPVNKKDAQGYGSAMTYARRYALVSALGLATGDDDDGNAAANAPPETVEAVKARIMRQISGLGFKDKSEVVAVFRRAKDETHAADDAAGYRKIEDRLAELDKDSVMGWLNGGAA